MANIPDDARKRLKAWGVACDDDGIPLGMPGPDARAACVRCGMMSENPTVVAVSHLEAGLDGEAPLCVDCFRLQFDDRRRFWDEGWSRGAG